MGWGWAEREALEGGDMCMHMTDLLHCTAETNITLQSNCISMKKLLILIEKKNKREIEDRKTQRLPEGSG